MGIRKRGLTIAAVTMLGIGLTTGVAAADYWQLQGHFPTIEQCQATGEEYLWPHNPGGADDYECQVNGDGWDLWLIFAT